MEEFPGDVRNVGGKAQAWCRISFKTPKGILNEHVHFLEEVETNRALSKDFRFGRMVEFDTRRVLEQTSTL